MADAYRVLSSEPTVVLVPPNKTRQMRLVTAEAQPSGVVFFLPVALVDMAPLNLNIILGTLAEEFNQLAARPGVVGVQVVQGISPGDALTQRVIVTVESPSGDSTDDVTLTWGESQGQAGFTKIANARKQLAEIEAL